MRKMYVRKGNIEMSEKEVMYMRKESRLASGLPMDRMVPIQLIACSECGTLVEDFIPAPLKQFYGKSTNQNI